MTFIQPEQSSGEVEISLSVSKKNYQPKSTDTVNVSGLLTTKKLLR